MNYPNFENDQLPIVGEKIGAISRWIDEDQTNRNNTALENLMLRTSIKIGEEQGELNGAIIGYTGQNPRKGYSASLQDVDSELFDIALAALGGSEHLHKNDGQVMARFAAHVERVRLRMVASIGEHEANLAALRQSANAAPNPEMARAFFESVESETRETIYDNPEVYNPDGTAR